MKRAAPKANKRKTATTAKRASEQKRLKQFQSDALHYLREAFAARFKEAPPEDWEIKDFIWFGMLLKQSPSVHKEITSAFLKVMKADRITSGDEGFFDWLNRSETNLATDYAVRRITRATKENDREFLAKLGEQVKRKPSPMSRLEVMMLALWEDAPGKLRPLQHLTDEAMTDFLQITTRQENLTLDQVRKTRQRLGLKTKRILVTGIERLHKDGKESFRYIYAPGV